MLYRPVGGSETWMERSRDSHSTGLSTVRIREPQYRLSGERDQNAISARGRKIYVASSWRNALQPSIVRLLREAGHEVYDFRNPAPGQHGFAWSEVNPNWLAWTPEQFVHDLYAGNPAVERGFAFDKDALDWADTCVLVLPCGRSAHLEAGYAAGQGKLTLFYLHPDKFEPELMYLLGHGCVTSPTELLAVLGREGTDGNEVRLKASGEGGPK